MTLLNESRAVDLQIRWAELALESAQLQYDIAVSESSDGVLTESENEALFMEAEAAAQKSKNIIIRAIEKVIDFIKSVASKIAADFSEKKVKSDLEEIKKIQNDPNVKGAKVEVPDWKDAEKNVKEYEKAIADAEKKAKAGKLTQADIDKMNDAKSNCGAVKKITIGAAAAAVAVGGTLLSYKLRLNKIQSDLEGERKTLKDNQISLNNLITSSRNLSKDAKSRKANAENQYNFVVDPNDKRLETIDKNRQKAIDDISAAAHTHAAARLGLKDNADKMRDLDARESNAPKTIFALAKADLGRAKAKLESLYASIFKKSSETAFNLPAVVTEE